MRRIFCLHSLALLSVLVALCPRAARESVQAGTAVRMDLAQLVEHAELVLEGRVLAQSVRRDPSGRIDTDSTLSVEHTFFGEALGLRTIRLPGGVLPQEQGGGGMLIAGMPDLRVGEDVLLFLTRPNASGMRMPIGLAQGKFRIVSATDGARLLVREQAALALVDPRSGAISAARDDGALDHTSVAAQLEQLCAQKRARLERATHGTEAR